MKRVFTLLLLALLLASPVMAKSSDSVDDTYDFKGVKAVLVYDLDDPASQLDDMDRDTVQDAYHLQAAKLLEIPSLTQTELAQKISAGDLDNPKPYDTELPKYVQMYVKAQLNRYEVGTQIIPAHTEWRTMRERAAYRDRDGRWREMWVDRPVPVFVPDTPQSYIVVRVKFTGYDAATHKAVFLREEQRQNVATTDRLGMFNRIVRSYFRDLRKKVKK